MTTVVQRVHFGEDKASELGLGPDLVRAVLYGHVLIRPSANKVRSTSYIDNWCVGLPSPYP